MSPQKWVGLGALVLAAAGAILLGMMLLPRIFVQEAGLSSAETQSAYNASRAAVGVVIAAVLAAGAAISSMMVTRKSVQAAERGIAINEQANIDARDRYERDLQERAQERLAGQNRWLEDQYSARFGAATAQLGDEKAAVRLAGVYALARLADDWDHQRQTCVNVLCAYLRMPWPLDENTADREVRKTVVSAIADRCSTSPPHHDLNKRAAWADLHFDFAGAEFMDEVNLNGCEFRSLSLQNAVARSSLHLEAVTTRSINDFSGLQIHGDVGIRLRGEGQLKLRDAVVHSGGSLSVEHENTFGSSSPGIRPAVTLGGLQVNAGDVWLGIENNAAKSHIRGGHVSLSDGAHMHVAFDSSFADCAAGALELAGVTLDQTSRIFVEPHPAATYAVRVTAADGAEAPLDVEEFAQGAIWHRQSQERRARGQR